MKSLVVKLHALFFVNFKKPFSTALFRETAFELMYWCDCNKPQCVVQAIMDISNNKNNIALQATKKLESICERGK